MKEYDIVGFGSSVLDIAVEVNDNFLEENNLIKGNFTLIDDEKSEIILKKISNLKQITSPGGSVSNIIAGAALLGAKTAYIGGAGNDKEGRDYKKQTLSCGVNDYFIEKENSKNGFCIAFITPDKERTFAVNLGTCNFISTEDIEKKLDFKTKIIIIEGYKIESDIDYESVKILCDYGKKIGAKIAIDVNDANVIKKKWDRFHEFIDKYVDILFMNEIESVELTKILDEKAVEFFDNNCELVVLKVGEKGSYIRNENKTTKIDANPTDKLVNTSGAGDAYAAAFLYMHLKGKSIEEIGWFASLYAKKVVEIAEARHSTLPDDIKKLL